MYYALGRKTNSQLFAMLERLRANQRPPHENIQKRLEILLELQRRTGIWHSY